MKTEVIKESYTDDRRNFLSKLFFVILAFFSSLLFKNENGILGLQQANAEDLKAAEQNEVQLAEKLTVEPYHLNVGVNQKYKTITAAVNEWKNPATINKQPTVINIFKGVYKESIALYGVSANLTIKGENKKDVIWKTTKGYYPHHPLTIGGNVLIEGITFIADHSENQSYTFVPYTGGNTGGAYAIHIDVDGAIGKVTIKDCILQSYQNSGLGSGTRSNQEIELIDSEVYNFASASWREPVDNGAWLYHNSVATGATNERIKVRNTKFFNSNGQAITLENYNADSTLILLEAINNTLSSGIITTPDQLVKIKLKSGATQNKIIPTGNSHGNNNNFLNNVKYAIDNNGNVPSVSNVNLASISGEYQCNSNTPNAPTTDAYFIKTISANNQYKMQYAWRMVDTTKKYRRSMSAGVWGSWIVCAE